MKITQKIKVDIIERAGKISKKVENMENIEYNKSVQTEINVLFDVSCCKCSIQDEICRCPLERKILQREWTFLIDQRNDRKMFVGGLDFNTTSKNVANQSERRQKLKSRRKRERENISRSR